MSMRTVYFHEDDYCQIEILPAQNWKHCATQLGNIAEFSEKHRAANGMGWTDVYARDEEPMSLSTLGLSVKRIAQSVAKDLPEFDRIDTGYSSHKEQCTHTRGFGFDADCVLYLSEDQEGNLERLWLGLGGPGELERSALLRALTNLSALGDFLLVDWGWERLFLLNDSAAIAGYLSERDEHFRKMHEDMQRKRQQQTLKRQAPWWKFWG